ncbi:hypothetical protein V1506DRAFT_538893 [Lipomyces tetrasporus]
MRRGNIVTSTYISARFFSFMPGIYSLVRRHANNSPHSARLLTCAGSLGAIIFVIGLTSHVYLHLETKLTKFGCRPYQYSLYPVKPMRCVMLIHIGVAELSAYAKTHGFVMLSSYNGSASQGLASPPVLLLV